MYVIPYRALLVRQEHPYNRYGESYGPIRAQKMLAELVQNGTLKKDGPVCEVDSQVITTPLKEHQKRLLYEMKRYENCQYNYTDRRRVGFLGDTVGSGKSLTILSLISANKEIEGGKSMRVPFISPLTSYDGSPHIPKVMNPYDENANFKSLRSTLIVVPHIIFSQWKGYIKNDTALKAFYVSSKNNITQFVDQLEGFITSPDTAPDVVLVKSTTYNRFITDINNKGQEYDTLTEIQNLEPSEGSIDASICNIIDMVQTLRSNARQLAILRNAYRSGSESITALADAFVSLREMIEGNQQHIDRVMSSQQTESGKLVLRQIVPKSGVMWNRVIFDEADTIGIGNSREVLSKMVWMVSASTSSLVYPHTAPPPHHRGFIRDLLDGQLLISFYSQYAYFTSSREAILESFPLPDVQVQNVICHTPSHVRAAYASNRRDVIDAVNAGDIEQAINMCNCDRQDNADGLIGSLRSNMQQQIEDLRQKQVRLDNLIRICNEKQQEYQDCLREIGPVDQLTDPDQISRHVQVASALRMTIRNISMYEDRKQQNESSIESLNQRLQTIQERVEETMTQDCPICLEEIEKDKRVIVKCCNQTFCVDCVLQQIASYRDRTTTCPCPMCRARLGTDTFTLIRSSGAATGGGSSESEQLPTKKQALFNLIADKRAHPRVLLFSSFDATFQNIQEQMQSRGITYELLNGSDGSIQRKIRDHMGGKVQVLCMNSRMLGQGLNLQYASDIVIYHRQQNDLEQQIIGRAQRPGRDPSQPLRVWRLSHAMEYGRN